MNRDSRKDIQSILEFLDNERGVDFKGNRISMLERRINKRLLSTGKENFNEYFEYLRNEQIEIDNLIDVLTINVSRFFRDSLSFKYISKIIIPSVIQRKINSTESLRIWSAGCSFGEEPYSMAIIINEFLRKEEASVLLNIFATDIDKKALISANKGCYNFESIKHLQYLILDRYFTQEGNQFILDSEIKNMVQFSFHDLLDKKRFAPPDSIFGEFDIVLCRNVLIYFNPEYQKIIFSKLYRSLKPNGYLVLGETEVPIEEFKHKFRKENKYCKIYRKIG